MSTLQITFIVLGVAVILAVFGYNLWYNARHAPRKARELFDAPATQIPPDARREPAFDETGMHTAADPVRAHEPGWEGAVADAPAPAQQLAKPGGLFGKGRKAGPALQDQQNLEAVAVAPPPTSPAPAAPAAALASESGAVAPESPSQEFDSLIFSVVPLALDKPVTGEAMMAALPPTRRIGKKQFLVQGLNMQTRQWEAPHSGARYSACEAAIQLANRQGALNELEFSEFVAKTQDFADAIGAAPDFPDMLHEVARGREVDTFAAANDAVLNLMLVAQRATWSPGYVHQCAARHGFKSSVTPGRLVLPAAHPHQPPVLVLSYDPQAAMADDLDHTPISEILLTLDVPNVDRGENAFERLRAILDEMAQTMEGQVTDPDGRRLPAMALDSIGEDLARLYDALESRGFAAGSPSALKLFS